MQTYSFHEYANLFPMLDEIELAELTSDIRQRGLEEDIVLYEGKILDGRNRYLACREAGVTPRFVQYAGRDALGFVVSKNLHRRHLNSSQRAVIALDLLPMMEAQARERQLAQLKRGDVLPVVEQIPEREQGRARDQAATIIGTNPHYVSDAKKISEEAPELIPQIREGSLSVPEAKKRLRQRQIEERRAQKQTERVRGDQQDAYIRLGDMRELSDSIPDNSIDMVLTDPPYPEEYLPLFGDLSRVAARVLRPGGVCLVYSGQIHLPAVMDYLGQNLEYVWTCAIRHTGGNQRIWKANINTAWKPVLWYVKPPRDVYWDSFIDTTSGGREKDLHGWQQAEAEAAYFISHLCPPGGTVFDPFCGSGTTLVAARRLGCVPVGFDNDPIAVDTARRRLDDAAAER